MQSQQASIITGALYMARNEWNRTSWCTQLELACTYLWSIVYIWDQHLLVLQAACSDKHGSLNKHLLTTIAVWIMWHAPLGISACLLSCNETYFLMLPHFGREIWHTAAIRLDPKNSLEQMPALWSIRCTSVATVSHYQKKKKKVWRNGNFRWPRFTAVVEIKTCTKITYGFCK